MWHPFIYLYRHGCLALTVWFYVWWKKASNYEDLVATFFLQSFYISVLMISWIQEHEPSFVVLIYLT